jgi:hypothetical protein
MNPVEQLITLRGIELETLHGAGPLAFEVYVMLRWWMDYRTGITGRRRPISLAMLITYCETHTPGRRDADRAAHREEHPGRARTP